MKRRAFTLVEMLVVIGIIVLIIGIALPMLNQAWKNAVKTRMGADLQAISVGLDAYRQDFKDFPRIDYSVIGPGGANGINVPTSANTIQIPGAVVLCWALLAPGLDAQDGADGPGFRVRSFANASSPSGSTGQGQVYGPYIAAGRFNIGNGTDDSYSTINDRYGHPYLYFPANKGANPNRQNPPAVPTTIHGHFVEAWSPTSTNPPPMFNATDGVQAFRHTGETDDSLSLPRLQASMGDLNASGDIDGSETAAYVGNYILWGAGPDEAYGPNVLVAGSPNTFDLNHLDDVSNFNR